MPNSSRPPGPPWTILKVLNWTTDYFASHGIESPRMGSEILLARTLNLDRIGLYTNFDRPLTPPELAAFKQFIKRRIAFEPVAYITGEKHFWTLTLAVTPDVLIPRPETEHLVEVACNCLKTDPKSPKTILDMGTGSGALILSLAAMFPQHRCFASDSSVHALHIASANKTRNKIGPVHFFCGRWFAPLSNRKQRFDLILSNPPYIRSDDIAGLQPEIALFEPKTALDGGKTGLDHISRIIFAAPEFLNPGGFLILEHGWDQKPAISSIIDKSGAYHNTEFFKDYAGCDRVVKIGIA